ncbi:YabP/YqfC family sporulation protein [Dehalobacter sp. DCM]|uniref:YabP/YqfC family sporulation protein n=1 Tax=Dehalobacter sp. DCM TaxID=2907827 RepID=UPI003081F1AD|nr:YabP/YqfC family sporulation protein [Dehalobacter sp. DCM]
MFKKIQEQAGKILEFPPDVLDNGPKVTVLGRSEIIIEDYLEVTGFSDSEITVRTSLGKLTMQGETLVLSSVADMEIHIKGRISGLFFEEG